MAPERWTQIERIFQQALQEDSRRRPDFVREACGGDNGILREVEEMLACHDSDDSFLERPALEIAIARNGMDNDTLRRQFESALAGPGSLKSCVREFRLAPGVQLGPYLIEAPVSAGGMGEIYRASDTRLGRKVALKILASRLMGDAGMRGRFEAEARAISRLNHPHICTLYDIGREQDIDYLVMEYLEGETLARRLEQGPLPYPETISIASQICEALAYSHAHDVIHRDLKPGNIILTALGAKLVDFGLARWEQEARILGAVNLGTSDSSLTVTGLILGTPQYMAPEQIERQPVDARTDIFALGSVIFEMASGRKAFTGARPSDVMHAISSSDAPALDALPELSSLVQRCLRRRPDDRWQSAGELSSALRKLQDPARQQVWWRSAILMPAVLALAALGTGDRSTRGAQIVVRHDTTLNTISAFPGKDDQLSGPNCIIRGPNGVLYGTTWQFGGPTWSGSVFELDPPARENAPWRRSILYAFSGGRDGANPVALLPGKNGRLYGITSWGGNGGNGTVFELTPPRSPGQPWTQSVIHHFTRVNGDGCYPTGALALGPNGEIYGTTQNGGTPGQGRGIAYRLSPPGNHETEWTMRVLHIFTNGDDGTNPEGGLVRGRDGNLYGLTGWGAGLPLVVFQLVPGSDPAADWNEVVLHRLVYEEGHGRNGNPLTFGPDGLLYGSTLGTRGSVFVLSPPTAGRQVWVESLLHSFIGAFGEGIGVVGSITVGPNSYLYGTTGGSGTIFQLAPPPARQGAWIETILHSFKKSQEPYAPGSALPLLLADPHTLIGTTTTGGPLHGGAVYELKF
ncbi:MAG TPA: choice-of-anchor tandem repeat GloVer-containing protein [Bryobacteraceae bacterium]|nr:choice-of-anchor tandem repeat GloVer-containing protein [Bryobacteraceae bacterium]